MLAEKGRVITDAEIEAALDPLELAQLRSARDSGRHERARDIRARARMRVYAARKLKRGTSV